MIGFNTLLRSAGVDPAQVVLVRHQDARALKGRAPHVLWRTEPEALELYQRIQGKDRFPVGSILASFVVTLAGETLFIGLYEVTAKSKTPPDLVDPVSGKATDGKFFYDIHRDERLAEYRGKLVVDWGRGYLAWTQRAGKQDKPVLEIRRAVADPPFPGFADFRHDVATIETIPEQWKEVLRAVKGVYVLACQETGDLYVGSAKGGESLWGRFAEYAANGHGGNVMLKQRGPMPYRVSVLEIANSGEGIERLEEAWKQKLLTRQFGLNDPVFSPDPTPIAAFAEVLDRPGYSLGEWRSPKHEDGSVQFPFYEFDEEAEAFLHTLWRTEWIIQSGWSYAKWKDSPEATALRDDPKKLAKASPLQAARLLTTILQGERMVEGQVASAWESGLLRRIVAWAEKRT
ncbi:DUF6508 domain-containing protein [Aureimonas psammosilenae]|uniref:DUF6508 domain-containing protein n=1 Tax=Aureimonas psammosilenae TaxID=2495496 RepID=UPI001260E28D|nr:DUF6508 domain-containing protein [Aureimonas psammosilenae]